MSYINIFRYGKNKLQSGTESIFPKNDFPIFSKSNLVWFDNGATTHKPQIVIDNIKNYYENYNSNIHRSPHKLSMISSEMFDDSRNTAASYIGCEPSEIVFVRGTTEGINFLSNSLNYVKLGAGAILLSNAEHHSNIVPWQLVAKSKMLGLDYLYFDKENNTFDLVALENMLIKNPLLKIVSICHVSNVTGICNPISEIAAIVHKYNGILIVDGAQGLPHFRVNVKELGCDAYVFSAHKLFGPTGVGAVYCNKNLYEYLDVWQGGGSMITNVTLYTTATAQPPYKFEAGTPNIADVIAFGETLKYLMQYDWKLVQEYEEYLTKYMYNSLNSIPGIFIIGNTLKNKVPVFSFDISNIDKEKLLVDFDNNGIAIRYGHHCAQPIVRYHGLESVFRASLAPYNTIADIDKFISIIKNNILTN